MTNPDPKANPTDWKTVRNWIFDREGKHEVRRRQIYALSDWIYHGVHFGMLSVYEYPGDTSEGGFDPTRRHERDVMNFYIATSRDADSWDLRWVYSGQTMIRRGGEGDFDNDLLLAASSIVTYKDRHWIYYSAANERHGTPEVVFNRKSVIGLATLRLDGFISLTARNKPGTLITTPFVLKGSQLELNIEAPKGEAVVELLDATRRPIRGYRAQLSRVDNVRESVSFQESLSKLKDKAVRLRIQLRNASLYAFQFRK